MLLAMAPYLLAVALALLAMALLWGRGPERLAAAVLAMAPLLDRGMTALPLFHVLAREWMIAHFAIDAVAFLALALIAVEANRLYTLVLGALQLLVLLAHVTRLIEPRIAPEAAEMLLAGPAWLQQGVMAIGLLSHRLRERRWGPTRSWRRSGEPPFNLPPNF